MWESLSFVPLRQNESAYKEQLQHVAYHFAIIIIMCVVRWDMSRSLPPWAGTCLADKSTSCQACLLMVSLTLSETASVISVTVLFTGQKEMMSLYGYLTLCWCSFYLNVMSVSSCVGTVMEMLWDLVIFTKMHCCILEIKQTCWVHFCPHDTFVKTNVKKKMHCLYLCLLASSLFLLCLLSVLIMHVSTCTCMILIKQGPAP